MAERRRYTLASLGTASGVVLALAVLGAVAPAAAQEAAELARQRVAEAAGWLQRSVQRGFERQPAMMLAGALALALPTVALLAALMRGVWRLARRRERERPGEPVTSGRRTSTAWIELETQRGTPIRIGELARLGSDDDCEIVVGGAGLAETHALIQRTSDYEFIIVDVSANEGAGVAVNGKPAHRSRLRDGDLIEIGAARAVFRLGVPGVPAAGLRA